MDLGLKGLKAIVTGGEIGLPLLMHAAHRNPSVPDTYTSEMIINDSTVHDIDVARWMFDDEIAAVRVGRVQGAQRGDGPGRHGISPRRRR